MQIMNTFVSKFGSGGKRNRAARRRLERRKQLHTSNKSTETLIVPEVKVDLSATWNETIARKALELFEKSGKSQRAFAAEHNFPDSRLRSWKKKLEALTIN